MESVVASGLESGSASWEKYNFLTFDSCLCNMKLKVYT